MYSIDSEDKVVELTTLPQSSVGAPIPLVLSDEYTTVVAYSLQDENYNPQFNNEPIAIVTFKHCLSVMFGPPNDEVFQGHPLATRGLSQPFRKKSANLVNKIKITCSFSIRFTCDFSLLLLD